LLEDWSRTGRSFLADDALQDEVEDLARHLSGELEDDLRLAGRNDERGIGDGQELWDEREPGAEVRDEGGRVLKFGCGQLAGVVAVCGARSRFLERLLAYIVNVRQGERRELRYIAAGRHGRFGRREGVWVVVEVEDVAGLEAVMSELELSTEFDR
jgi:hypothetical protein